MSTPSTTTASAAAGRISLMGVCLDPASYKALAHIVMSVPGGAVAGNAERYVGAEREVAYALEHAQSRICLIDMDQNPDEASWLVQRLLVDCPDMYIFAVSSSSAPDRIISAMRSGCTEYLIKPLQSERVMEALAHVEAKQKERIRSRVRGKIITVIGAKGGTGTTSLAMHLALSLSKLGDGRTLLVDQHPALGDVSLYLGTPRHQYSFYELAGNTDRLDEELLQGFVSHYEGSQLDVLDSPEALDATRFASPAAVEQTLRFLADIYPFVVLDCPPGLTDVTLASIAQSDQVAVVITAELPAVRNAARYLEHLLKLGYSSQTVSIVLNRHSKKGPLQDDKIEQALHQSIWLKVPNSYNEVIRAINSGMPVEAGRRSEFAQSIEEWARELLSQSSSRSSAQEPQQGGFFRRMIR